MGVTRAAAWPLDQAAYRSHALHAGRRTWTESNCYVDLWIEVLHALGLDPIACLAFTLGADFEGDQWTFFKPPLADLRDLYGLQVEELNVWRPLVDHSLEQLSLGRLVVSEVDACYLPDTLGTTYRVEHTKTSIGLQAVDLEAPRLGYFHGGGYYALEGADFDAVFRRTPTPLPVGTLAPYVEIVKLDGLFRLACETLVNRAMELTRRQVARLPAVNPFSMYKPRLEADLAWLRTQPVETFHAYAFATIRQFGASFELAAVFLRWLAEHGHLELTSPAAELDGISSDARVLLLKASRVAHGRHAGDVSSTLEAMAVAWQHATEQLRSYCAEHPPTSVAPARR